VQRLSTEARYDNGTPFAQLSAALTSGAVVDSRSHDAASRRSQRPLGPTASAAPTGWWKALSSSSIAEAVAEPDKWCLISCP
jgi:hypothetical protein